MVAYGFHDVYRPRWPTYLFVVAFGAAFFAVHRWFFGRPGFEDLLFNLFIVAMLARNDGFEVTTAGIKIGRRVTPWAEVEVHEGRSGDVLASASGTRRPAAKFEFTLNRYAKDWRTSPLGAHIACYAPHLVDPASAVTTLSSTSQ